MSHTVASARSVSPVKRAVNCSFGTTIHATMAVNPVLIKASVEKIATGSASSTARVQMGYHNFIQGPDSYDSLLVLGVNGCGSIQQQEGNPNDSSVESHF